MTAENDQLGSVLVKSQLLALSQLMRSYPLNRLFDAYVRNDRRNKALAHPNPLLKHGEKYFSQNDEDGILLEIIRRIGLKKGSFIEFGVGNGLENNSLILLMSGWRGGWAGGEELAFALPANNPKLAYNRIWITRENAWQIWVEMTKQVGVKDFDCLSIDLDGNDLYILQELLGCGSRPSVIVAEYNSKFPPPIEFCIQYDVNYRFQNSDYSGASLQSFVNVLGPFGYRLVACNITGANAFFVAEPFHSRFSDVPSSIDQLFVPPDYSIVIGSGHPPSPKTIATFLGI